MRAMAALGVQEPQLTYTSGRSEIGCRIVSYDIDV